jgi:hypothetical protein
MKTVQEYLRHAEECDALARKATSEEQRDQIVKMAQTWRMLGEERRQKLQKLGQVPDGSSAPALPPDQAKRGNE